MGGNSLTSQSAKILLLDACVLIDFFKSDKFVLESIVRYISPIKIISPIIDEINDIDSEDDLLELGIKIIEPEFEDGIISHSLPNTLSFVDKLCLLTAKRNHFICVTNDKLLRKNCIKNHVNTLWGLELLIKLYKSKGILKREVKNIARKIRDINPLHISSKILTRFYESIDEIKK